MKLTEYDIKPWLGGFTVEKIKQLTNEQLDKLEESITKKVAVVQWANIEEYGFLSVSFLRKIITTKEEREIIREELNKILNPKKHVSKL